MITADTHSDGRVVAATAAAVAAADAVPVIVTYPSSPRPNLEPPPPVAAAIAAADVWIEFAAGHTVYTAAWTAAVGRGVLYASLGGLDLDGLVRCIGRQDAHRLTAMAERIIALLTDADIAVTSRAGSDLVFHNRGATVGAFRMVATPERLPIMLAGQVSWTPNEASMRGVLVGDGILSPPAEVGLIAEPIRVAVEGGRITGIEGGREARLLKTWIAERRDPTLHRIAHISIGFNPGIPVPTGRILEDERAFGDLDFGWGAWVGRPAAGHFDFTCRQVSLTANGAEILRDGIFVDPVLAEHFRVMGVPGH